MTFQLVTVELVGYPDLLGEVAGHLAVRYPFDVPVGTGALSLSLTARGKHAPTAALYRYIPTPVPSSGITSDSPYSWLRNEITTLLPPDLARHFLDGYDQRNRAATARYKALRTRHRQQGGPS